MTLGKAFTTLTLNLFIYEDGDKTTYLFVLLGELMSQRTESVQNYFSQMLKGYC